MCLAQWSETQEKQSLVNTCPKCRDPFQWPKFIISGYLQWTIFSKEHADMHIKLVNEFGRSIAADMMSQQLAPKECNFSVQDTFTYYMDTGTGTSNTKIPVNIPANKVTSFNLWDEFVVFKAKLLEAMYTSHMRT
jgi:hypothetical protein